MDLNLRDKVIIVSGGASGIGEAICKLLSQENAILVVFDKDQKKGESLTKRLNGDGNRAFFHKVELMKPGACKRAVEKTFEKFKRLDALINNAGINDGAGLERGDPQKFRQSLERNLYHYYDLAHYCLPELKKSKGSILNIASKVAITGQGGTSGYAAAKGAQLALTREWAVELVKYGIRVNAILPAEVMTPLYRKWIQSFKEPDKKLSEIQQNIPLENRMTTAEEIASMAAYLISDQASHITGQHIFVDGGYVHLDRGLNS